MSNICIYKHCIMHSSSLLNKAKLHIHDRDTQIYTISINFIRQRWSQYEAIYDESVSSETYGETEGNNCRQNKRDLHPIMHVQRVMDHAFQNNKRESRSIVNTEEDGEEERI